MVSRITTALLFTCIFVVHFLSEQHVLCAKGLTRNAQSGLSHANFLKDLFHYLNVSQVGSALVASVRQCTLACVKVVTCFSFNVAACHDIDGRLYCELLASDKYNSSDKFQENLYYHHYSIYEHWTNQYKQQPNALVKFYQTWKTMKPIVTQQPQNDAHSESDTDDERPRKRQKKRQKRDKDQRNQRDRTSPTNKQSLKGQGSTDAEHMEDIVEDFQLSSEED